MTPPLRGHPLPETLEEFNQLLAGDLIRFPNCYACKKPHTGKNNKTTLDWRETQISGTCGACWTQMFAKENEEDDDATES